MCDEIMAKCFALQMKIIMQQMEEIQIMLSIETLRSNTKECSQTAPNK
jgi:hypothetical protein